MNLGFRKGILLLSLGLFAALVSLQQTPEAVYPIQVSSIQSPADAPLHWPANAPAAVDEQIPDSELPMGVVLPKKQFRKWSQVSWVAENFGVKINSRLDRPPQPLC